MGYASSGATRPPSLPSIRNRISSSVLVILAPVLLLAVVGVLSGSLDLGGTEEGALMVIWVVGLVWVWVIGPARGRRSRH